ncbi:L-type lectin-domain containing receptor kinase IX.1-like [Phoenix dactylifera]|uniref:non-specific serine/threonine protein kinase n=1 Tax=Phoenix dactylifera TaxID=42345 RepID=A0A8B9B055_PHODC|nr:L-type lectin-domain containing receptor kinase IX.1-like [Phoenix dactylifera]
MLLLFPSMILSRSRTPLPSIQLLVLLLQLVCIKISHALSFSYSSFDTTAGGITMDGDAYFLDGAIQVTKNQADSSILNSTGSVVYNEPVLLWDQASGKVADFSANFSFIIQALQGNVSADGIAFFLSSYPYQNASVSDSNGGALGLFLRSGANWTRPKQIVAVEFDTFKNPEYNDSSANHIGIDFNRIISVAHRDLDTSIREGHRLDASISYSASTGNLTVFLSNFSDPRINWSLSYGVNLTDYLPEKVAVGFSAATGNQTETHKILSWSFNSTDLGPRPPRHKKFALGLGLAIAAVVLLSCVLCSVRFIRKYICKKASTEMEEDEEEEEDMTIDILVSDAVQRASGPRRFPYSVLADATNNFAAEGKLGQGGFGGVYVGVLHDPQLEVAIKRISRDSKQGRKEYISEITIIGQLRHRNLVQLIGYCHRRDDLLLVYEYMPNKSLDYHLYNKDRLLAWPERYKIALGLASALLYLHEEWEQCVIHRDVKPSNVMLDSEFNAKLGDFGLARLVDHDCDSLTTVLMGTRGYMAPEYSNTGKASKESDVYSFGVVILEMACGRKPVEARKKKSEVSLVEWVWELYGKGMCLVAADGRLNLKFDEQQVQRLMTVGLWCAHPAYNHRPSIRQAIHVLQCDAPLPNLPRKMPVPIYCPAIEDLYNLASTSSNMYSLTSISGR